MKKRHMNIEKEDNCRFLRAVYDMGHALVFACIVLILFFTFVYRILTIDCLAILTREQNDSIVGSIVVYKDSDGEFHIAQLAAKSKQIITIDSESEKILIDSREVFSYNDENMLPSAFDSEAEVMVSEHQFFAAELCTDYDNALDVKSYCFIAEDDILATAQAVIWPALLIGFLN